MPYLPLQIITLVADLAMLVFVAYYFFVLRAKEKELDKKATKVDTDYHKIVDTALAKERKILEDATTEADRILTSAQYVNRASSEEVNRALQSMVADIQREAVAAATNFMADYQTSLKQLSQQSLTDFQNISAGLQTDLQQQIQEFHQNLLPNLEKELAVYKQTRLEQAEQLVKRVVQKTAQEFLNKSLPFDDHQNLILQSLEKAKQEGVFD